MEKGDNPTPKRRSIRLRRYDYARAGAYFVTIGAQNRTCLFGNIVDGNMVLNDAGRMVERWYLELAHKFTDIQCDTFVCMPNHTHFVVVNVGADLRVRPPVYPSAMETSSISDEPIQTGEHIGSPLRDSLRGVLIGA